MQKRKVVYIISGIEKALAFEWIVTYLSKEKIVLQFILIGKRNTQLSIFLHNQNIKYHEVEFKNNKNIIHVWIKIFMIIWQQKPDVIHTHMWLASLIGLSTSWLLRIKKRIYTRHHAMIHHREYPSGLKWDRLIQWLATDIIAISSNVRDILINLEKVNPDKITLINHGFDFNYFQHVEIDRIDRLRKKNELDRNLAPVIGVISRYLKLKGIQYIIPAFKEIIKEYPNAHLILANANGQYSNEIKSLLSTLPPGSYTEIFFEDDLVSLYRLFDIFVHVPIDKFSEAFGQTYVEALAAEVPSVFTLSGIACDFIEHEKNALVVDYKNTDSIIKAINRILKNKDLRESLRKAGKLSVLKKFSIDKMILQLESIYTTCSSSNLTTSGKSPLKIKFSD